MLTAILRTAPIVLLVGGVGTVGVDESLGASEQSVKRSADSEMLAFVRFALRDRLIAGDIPDIGIAREPGAAQVYVRADLLSSRAVLTAEALPEIPGLVLRLITLSDAREMSERGGRVAFITVDKIQVRRDSAVIWLGADYVAPEQPGLVKLCCCEGEARFIKRDAAWVFEKWGFDRCS